MIPAHRKAGAHTVGADITSADSGGFTAIASDGDIDRDGERILPGCFVPLPESVPCHIGHTMNPSDVVARARPYYSGDVLMVDARFTSTADAQGVRTKVVDGTLDSLSVVFRGLQWEDIEGVRTCVRGELLAADIVSVPSNRGARILSMRSLRMDPAGQARGAVADALLFLARVEAREARDILRASRGPVALHVDRLLSELGAHPHRRSY